MNSVYSVEDTEWTKVFFPNHRVQMEQKTSNGFASGWKYKSQYKCKWEEVHILPWI